MQMNRRNFLVTGVSLIALVGCTAAQVTAALQQAAADAQSIGNGLKAVLPQIGTLVGINPATVALIGSAVADIQTAAAGIGAAASASAALPSVQQLEGDFNSIVSALAAVPLIPPPISTALQAASILLPPIESAVGLVVAPAAAAAPHALATASPTVNTPAAARAFLNLLK
jgi:hypothetical protein